MHTSEIEKLVEQYKKLEKAEIELKTTLKGDLTTRGRWGEIELAKIFELANMTNHVSYITQTKKNNLQPDFVVKLPEKKSLLIQRLPQRFLNPMIKVMNKKAQNMPRMFLKVLEVW